MGMKFPMANKRKMFSSLIIGVPILLLVGIVAVSGDWKNYFNLKKQDATPAVLGILFGSTPSPTPLPTATPIPTPTAVPFSAAIIYWPDEELTEGDTATFTWDIGGPQVIIHTAAIYYGKTSTPGVLTRNADPETTQYTGTTADFLKGEFLIPIRFVANIPRMAPGQYYFRGYALIEGKHYWTDERTFTVRSKPRHDITIVDYPKTITKGNSASFTWEVSGPAAETGFTAILAGKESKPGPLDPSVETTMTPYRIIVNDFTTGTTKVPLRFVGNASMQDSGVYYFRAVAFINGKNIWSDEQSFTVE